jgi:hypothetical protein
MIVKSYSRKSASFRAVLRYVTRHGRAAGACLLLNLPGCDPGDMNAVSRAFQENACSLPPRRGGVVLYHEYLSFHPGDTPVLTPAIIRDLTVRYLTLRAPGFPAWGAIHLDRPHPHIHLLIAANRPGRSRKLRLSRGEFAAVKRELEAYQRERYPQLKHSFAQPSPEREPAAREDSDSPRPPPPAALPPGSVRADARARRLAREGREDPARKDLLRDQLLKALAGADSENAFVCRLEAAGIPGYHYRGRLTGVISGGRKHRFDNLGVTDAIAAARARWRCLPGRLKILQDDRLERTRRYCRSFGYADELLETIAPPPATPRERLLQDDRRQRRLRRREARFRETERGREPPAGGR